MSARGLDVFSESCVEPEDIVVREIMHRACVRGTTGNLCSLRAQAG
jgi:hypothetical protein